jgi:hypothetical protein
MRLIWDTDPDVFLSRKYEKVRSFAPVEFILVACFLAKHPKRNLHMAIGDIKLFRASVRNTHNDLRQNTTVYKSGWHIIEELFERRGVEGDLSSGIIPHEPDSDGERYEEVRKEQIARKHEKLAPPEKKQRNTPRTAAVVATESGFRESGSPEATEADYIYPAFADTTPMTTRATRSGGPSSSATSGTSNVPLRPGGIPIPTMGGHSRQSNVEVKPRQRGYAPNPVARSKSKSIATSTLDSEVQSSSSTKNPSSTTAVTSNVKIKSEFAKRKFLDSDSDEERGPKSPRLR